MLKQIIIKGAPAFEEGQTLEGLNRLNFIFGNNGTGKTTISRILREAEKYQTCSLEWHDQNILQTLVYNSDFVEENFRVNGHIAGVFTLGKEEADDALALKVASEEVEKLSNDIKNANQSLFGDENSSGLIERKLSALNAFTDLCWKEKDNFPKLRDGFKGSLNSKINFRDVTLEHYNNKNNTKLVKIEELENEAASLFAGDISEIEDFQPIDLEEVINIENNDIFEKIVTGNNDSYIAETINKLGNADWVRRGVHYHEKDEDHCPFCQQKTGEEFKYALKDFFNESYEKALNEIKTIGSNYKTKIEELEMIELKIAKYPNTMSGIETFKSTLISLLNSMRLNLEKMREKFREPSKSIGIDKSGEYIQIAQVLSNELSQKVKQHNLLVSEAKSKTEELRRKIWRYFVEQFKTQIENFLSEQINFDKDILEKQKIISSHSESLEIKGRIIEKISANITNILSTMNDINKLLNSFGFNGFKLSLSDDTTGYQLIRDNGEIANSTLSEGERTFIAFLYFYHLILGSKDLKDISTNKIVVVDDPISSLDSDVLFIVCALVYNIAHSACNKDSPIQQLIMLTHNTAFHNNVTEKIERNTKFHERKKQKKYGFWVTRKIDNKSYIFKYEKNPISSSYNLLWDEVKRAHHDDGNVSSGLQNAIRRILEYYFNFLGGISTEELKLKLTDEEQMLRDSMMAWANSGSHGKIDDLYISPIYCDNKKYIEIFKRIFLAEGHISHFNMMMDIDEEMEEVDKEIVEN